MRKEQVHSAKAKAAGAERSGEAQRRKAQERTTAMGGAKVPRAQHIVPCERRGSVVCLWFLFLLSGGTGSVPKCGV